MKKSQTFLAYYSLLLATLLIGWSLFFSAQPTGFVQAILLLPISIYFWILISGKMPHDTGHTSENISFDKILGVLLSIALLIGGSSILMFMLLSRTHESSTSTEKIAGIEETLRDIQTDISKLNKGADAIEKIEVKLGLVQSSLLKLENNTDDTIVDDTIKGVLDSLTATPDATPISHTNN